MSAAAGSVVPDVLREVAQGARDAARSDHPPRYSRAEVINAAGTIVNGPFAYTSDMPKVVRERVVVDADVAEVTERVRRGLHSQWLAGVDQAWVVTRSDLDGFDVAVGARSAMDWGGTVLTGRFVAVGEACTEVALEVAMSRMGVWFSRLWGLVAFGAFVLSILSRSGFMAAYMLLMLGFIYVPFALAARRHDLRVRAVFEAALDVLRGSQAGVPVERSEERTPEGRQTQVGASGPRARAEEPP